MTTADAEEKMTTVPQWILETYPQQTTIILYEAIINGRLALPPDDIFVLPPDSPELAAYIEAHAILSLAQDQLYYTIQEAMQEKTV